MLLTQRRYVFTEARRAGIDFPSDAKINVFLRRRSMASVPPLVATTSGLKASTMVLAYLSGKHEISIRTQYLVLSFLHSSLTKLGALRLTLDLSRSVPAAS